MINHAKEKIKMSKLNSNILGKFGKAISEHEHFSISDYLEKASTDASLYANVYQRLLQAIGEPVRVDTKNDLRLGRIFGNREIKTYAAFSEFYGMEDTIEQIVSFLKRAAQGLEESKAVLYLLGPVGSAKSSLAERLKALIQKEPIYVLTDAEGQLSPVFENPLNVFKYAQAEKEIAEQYGIPLTAFPSVPSPWAIQKLKDYNGDVSKFNVTKIYPNIYTRTAVAKVEPGDENNQDISALIGKTDIRTLEDYSQDHAYSYSYSGGLCRGNQGIMEFVEMFKAPIKTLHPLLTATQEKNYNGTEAISSIPFEGMILAHSNESEWQNFKNDKKHEAFIDRIVTVKVPYCLRVSEEQQIYNKLLANSALAKAPCAPGTLEMLARFCVLTRLAPTDNSTMFSKMRVYDGENIKDKDPKAKPLQEYRDAAGVNEGMSGISTRFAFKVLSKTFNADPDEVAANPVHLLYVLENALAQEQFPKDQGQKYLDFIKSDLQPKYIEFLERELRTAFLESYSDYGQNIFERYFTYADAWISDIDFRDPDTNEMFDREMLNKELEKIEKPAGIANPKDFRSEIVNYVLRHRAANKGESPRWNAFEKIKTVIEKRMFSSTEEILPVISFTVKASEDEQKKHDAFVQRMIDMGYSSKQCKLLVQWYNQASKRT